MTNPSNPPKSSSSIPPKSPSAEELRSVLNESPELRDRGQQLLNETLSEYPPPNQPERSSVLPVDAIDDMTDAADTFAQGVENITSALLVLLGRYEDLCRSTQRVVRTLVLLSVMMITLLVGLTYMIIRLEGLVDAARVDREHMREMTGQLGLVKESQYQLTRTRPEIGVVQAKDGSTVVRIRPSSESTAEVDIPVVLEPQSSARP